MISLFCFSATKLLINFLIYDKQVFKNISIVIHNIKDGILLLTVISDYYCVSYVFINLSIRVNAMANDNPDIPICRPPCCEKCVCRHHK